MLSLLAETTRNPMAFFGCFMIFPLSWWVLVLVRWMISGEIDVIIGSMGCMVAVIAVFIASSTQIPWIPPLVFVSMVGMGIMFPTIRRKITNMELRAIDVDRLLGYLNSVSQRPDLIPARMEAARLLWDLGFHQQCVEIARPVTAITNDAFVADQREFAIWQAKLAVHPSRELHCLNCGAKTDPGNVHCPRCFEVYLVRYLKGGVDATQAGKLIAGWALVAGLFVLIPSIAAAAPFEVSIVAIPILLLLGGYTGYRTFLAKE